MTKSDPAKTEVSASAEELWIDAAHQILVEQGVEAVKIQTLAKQIGVSRTSFYWRFSDRDALLQALVNRWRRKNTGNLVHQSERYADSICEAVFNVFDCWLDDSLFDAGLDFALRNWAKGAPDLQRIVDAADGVRIDALSAMFKRFDYAPEDAARRGRTVYYAQIGYISMTVRESLEARLDEMPGYCAIYAGRAPSEAEIARLRDRHARKPRAGSKDAA